MIARSSFARQGARYDIVRPSFVYPVTAPRSLSILTRLSRTADGLPASETMYSMQGPSNKFMLRVDSSSDVRTTSRGTTATGVPYTIGLLSAGDDMQCQYWYDALPFGSESYAITVNGANRWPFRIGEGGGDGPGILNPYGMTIGNDFGVEPWAGSIVATDYTPTNHGLAGIPVYEFAMFGDSTTDWSPTWVSTCNLVYSSGQRWTRPGIAQLAAGGSLISDQKAEWQNPSCDTMRGAAGMKCFVYLIGLNNVIAAEASASILAELQDLRDTCATDNPLAKHVMCTLTPCRAFLSGAAYAIWQAVNIGISSTITGLDAVLDIANTALNDGSDNLAAAYDSGDHLHPNNAGRAIIAANYVTGLQGLGLLP